ncbi:unnamed protein product [Caenorhabditis angaria]|uniref:Uncharacterized protein n=1 Tax=Caenorhabditis angaria TaxID=860376 RepID=A0A9P1IJB0_9PELO|nr:unnamed protein product [Caenorhabditis angaria]
MSNFEDPTKVIDNMDFQPIVSQNHRENLYAKLEETINITRNCIEEMNRERDELKRQFAEIREMNAEADKCIKIQREQIQITQESSQDLTKNLTLTDDDKENQN